MSKGTCPVCNGSGRRPCPDDLRKYGPALYGYRAEDDTIGCNNCGGQYQYGSPTGEVRLNAEGDPCTHGYVEKNIGRCYNQYTCIHCGDSYNIDSGD